MSIVTRKSQPVQLRCLPLVSSGSAFRYERMINGCWQPINRRDLSIAVGNFNIQGKSRGKHD